MKILLIQPGLTEDFDWAESSHRQLQPLAPAVIAGLTPEKHSVSFIDDRLEEIPYCSNPDLVGISTTTLTARRAYSIAHRFREKGVPVILGGHHPTLLPEEAVQHANSVLIGEAEEVWERVLDDYERDKPKRYYKAKDRPSLARVKPPRREIFKGKNYVPVEMVETTRGCPHNCDFCSVSAFFGSGYRHKPIENVIEEVKGLKNNLIFFVDDNIVGDPAYAKSLFEALSPLRIRWFSQASLLMARDEELLELMRESGCIGNLIGIETLSKANLAELGKSWNIHLPYEEAIKRIHAHGLGIYASFILGLAEDDEAALKKTFDFAVKSRFMAANFVILSPYPGTKTYKKLRDEDRLIEECWWMEPKYERPFFRPRNLSPFELARACDEMNLEFYRLRSIARRGLNWRANMGSPLEVLLYWLMNRALRREHKKKYRTFSKQQKGARV
jgi:radical SAM superfamily enzyme YgiQ (UPF0313 family)